MSVKSTIVIVLGAGDIGSAVAVALHRAGFAVVLCDEADPAWSRRGMAFTDAWYFGTADLDGVLAMFCSNVISIPLVLERRLIAATTWSWRGVVQAFGAAALVDARMRSDKADLRTGALITIGLGPGFVAGVNVEMAVEIAPGARLGSVICAGPTLPFAGEPNRIGGASHERFVFAPVAGRLTTDHRIGGRVLKGEVVGAIRTRLVVAPLDGVLRGLSARGARILEGTEIVEVDPRGHPAFCYGIDESPRAIAHGVIAALSGRGLPTAKARSLTNANHI